MGLEIETVSKLSCISKEKLKKYILRISGAQISQEKLFRYFSNQFLSVFLQSIWETGAYGKQSFSELNQMLSEKWLCNWQYRQQVHSKCGATTDQQAEEFSC